MADANQFWGEAIGSSGATAPKGFWGDPVGSKKAAPPIAAPQPVSPPEEPPEALPDEPVVIPRGYQQVPGKATLQPIPAPAPEPVRIPPGYERVAGTEKTGLPGPPAPPQPFVPSRRNAIAFQGMGTYSPEFQQAAEQFGREHPLEPGAAPLEPIAGRVRGVLRAAQGLAEASPPPPGKPRDLEKQARGVSDILGGAFETAEPLAGVGAVFAPGSTAATYLLATGAQKGTEALAKKSGAGPEVSKALGDVAATVVGGVGAHRIGKGIWEAAGQPEVTVGGVRLTPEAPPSGVQPSKPFGEMTDAELINHANAIERDPPRNAEWQKQQILREVTRRQAERRVPGQPPEAGAQEGAAGPENAGGIFWGDPVVRETEADIARQEAEETAKRSQDPVRDLMTTLAGVELPPESAPSPPESAPRPPESAPRPPESAPRPPESAPSPPESAPRPPEPGGSPGEPGVVEGPTVGTDVGADVPHVGTDVGQVGQAAPTEPGAAGHEAEVYTIKGRQVPVRYEVRESDNLTNSFQPGYPQEFQPRQTDRAGSRQRIEQRKGDMTGALMADSRLASDGAPIILPDGTVITRNHGTQALRELYGEDKPRAQDYKQWLIQNAEQFGLDPQHIAGMEKPVLTRVMTEPMSHGDIVSFAQEANMSSAARMSDAEMAATLSQRMTGPLMESFAPDEKGRPNVEFVRGLIQDLPVEEQSLFLDSEGKLSQTGARMVRDAIFAKAYPDPRAVERMAESENASLKNITGGMLQAAPQVARFQEAVHRGERFDLGLGAEISDAAAVLDNLQKHGLPLNDWLRQGSLTPRDQVVRKLVQIFSEQRKSAKKIGDVLKEYHTVADEVGDPRQQGMFDNPEPVSKDDILDIAYERARANWAPAAKKDVFGDEAPSGEREERGLASRAHAEKGRAGREGEEEEPQALAARKPKEPAAGQEGLFPPEEEPPKKNALELAQEKHRAEVEERKAKLTGKGEQESLLEGQEGVPVEGTTREKLLGEQLTAQMKSGMAAKPSKLKPAETRGMFEEEAPESGMLFARGVPESGERGPVFRQFRHDEAGATKALEKAAGGDAIAALEEKKFGYGDVDLVWGHPGIAPPEWEKGYGLAHILAKHPYMRGRLQAMLDRMTHHKRQGERAMLWNNNGEHATLALTWFGRENKTWLLTEYGQRPPAAENILFGSGNPVSEASEPSSPLTGSSDSTIPPPKGEVNTLESRRPTPGRVPEQMELFPNHITTPEMAAHPPARTTPFEVDPQKLPQLQDAPRNKTNRLPDYWKQAQAVAGDLNGRPALFVNNAGMDAFLQGAGATKWGTSENINGMAVSPELWDQLLENAPALRDDPSSRTETRSQAIVRVAGEVRKAARRDTPLIVVQTGHTKTPEKIKRVAEEEYDHVSQYALPGGLRGLPIDRVFGSPEGRLAAEALARNYGYPTLNAMSKPGDRLMILAEIGVRLMRPGLYREMDLSTQQALDLAQSFIMGLKQRHGKAAASMVDQFHAAIAKNQAAQSPRSGDLQKQHQESAPDLGRTGPRGPPQVSGDPLSRVGPESAALLSRQPARQPGSSAFTKRLAEQDEKQYGFNVRNWFTGRRDVWQARVNQVLEGLRKTLPDPIDQEALAIYRDFKDRPGELKQFLNHTHEAFGEVRDLDIAKQNIEQLRTPIERAMNPSDALREADQKLTAIAAASLAEGKRVGFIDQHIKPEQYVTHLLDRPSAEEPSKFEDMGRAIGGKMGLYFPYAQEREFPTLLHAAANNFKPRTLNAFTAFQTYGDKFATVRASHLLMQQLHDSHVGMWGVKGNKGIPEGWKPLAPHSDIFRKTIAVPGAEGGEPEAAELRLFVPKVIDDALRPITDPDYTARIAGFRLTRAWQAYTKAAQLGLSFFHAISLNYAGLANMGPRGYAQAWQAMMKGPLEPGFHAEELDLIQHGGTTPVQGKVYEKFSSVEPSSFPTLGERIRQMPGLKQIDRVSGALTELTFGKIQRSYKVIDYSLHKAAWLAKNPQATPAEYHGAMRSIAKELNSVYGGLHWENLGVNRSTLEALRFGMLAPDWAFSNWFQAKYAFEKAPAGDLARRYWLRAMLFGLGMTQAMSLMVSRQPSKRPSQVYFGKDKEGRDVYQNMFFKGAAGDAMNLAYNVKDFGFPVGIARTLGNKVAPGIRTAIELSRNETYLGQPIAAKGLNPLVSTIRGGANIATGLAPIPWSAANIAEMMMNRDKYNLPTEALTTLFAGTPPAHVKPGKDRETQTLWEQMKTGKPYAMPKRGSEEEKLGRELQRLTK